MPGAKPVREDDYYCTAFSVEKLLGGKDKTVYVTGNNQILHKGQNITLCNYATGFNGLATAKRAHHLILEKCEYPVREPGQIW